MADRRRKTPEDRIIWFWRILVLLALIHNPELWKTLGASLGF